MSINTGIGHLALFGRGNLLAYSFQPNDAFAPFSRELSRNRVLNRSSVITLVAQQNQGSALFVSRG